jgi:hypothetical protein
MTTDTDRPTREVHRPDLVVGDQVRFPPLRGPWWTVRAADDRYTVATAPEPLAPTGALVYTVIDWTGWARKTRNGAGLGPVRSSLNTIGGGWDLDPVDEGAAEILRVLHSGEFELSARRVLNVYRLEVRGA